MHENAEHAEIAAGLLKLGSIVTVLCVSWEGVPVVVFGVARHDRFKIDRFWLVMVINMVIAVAVVMCMIVTMMFCSDSQYSIAAYMMDCFPDTHHARMSH